MLTNTVFEISDGGKFRLNVSGASVMQYTSTDRLGDLNKKIDIKKTYKQDTLWKHSLFI